MALSMFVNGEFVSSASGAQSEIKNPATGEIIETVTTGAVEDAKSAIDSAYAAFPKWSSSPPQTRAKFLYKMAEAVSQNKDELAAAITMEEGKPLKEALSEVQNFGDRFEYFAGMGNKLRGSYIEMAVPGRSGLVLKRPIGVVGAIVPWNNPLGQLGGKLAPALVAGNTVVVKPASTTPISALKFAKVLKDIGLPKGVVNIVIGPGGVVGEEILRNSKVRKISMTASTESGRHAMNVASNEIKRITLELGGSDPMIVCDDADLEAATDWATRGRFQNCGQGCVTVKRLYVFSSIAEPFVKKVKEKVSRIVVGNGLDPKTTMGPLHTSGQRKEVEKQVADALGKGAKLVSGGQEPKGGVYDKGHFYEPTVVSDVDLSSEMAREEVFGPALPIFLVENMDQAITMANDSIYGLSSSVWTKDINKAMRAAKEIEAGTTGVNCIPWVNVEVPFGGFKQSGLGREYGTEGLEHFLETKSVVIQTS